jgi:hypothetical protein
VHDPRPSLPRPGNDRASHHRELASSASLLRRGEPPELLHPLQLRRRRRVAAQNGREQTERLRDAIWQQAQEIDRLHARIAELERPKPTPAIY